MVQKQSVRFGKGEHTSGTEVLKQTGQEWGGQLRTAICERQLMCEVLYSAVTLYTPLSVRAPCFPQAPSPNSPVDEHYLSLLIYSFSLVRVEQWRRGGLSVTLALLLQKSRMFHSNLHNVLYYAPSLTSAVNSQGQKENFSVSPTSISPPFILTKHF